jgi:RNA polymerase sigma-70 factor (ECF subfamily)
MTDALVYTTHKFGTTPKKALTTDAELVNLAQQGSHDAFSQLYRRYHTLAMWKAHKEVHNKETAEDLVQEAALKAYAAINTYRGESQFQTWFMKIVVNLCIDYLRMKKNQHHTEFDEVYVRDDVQERYQKPERAVVTKEIGFALDKGLEQLSPAAKKTLLLRECGGMTYEEIAQRLNVPIGTVMSRLFYARRDMQRFMQEYFPEFVYVSLKKAGTVSEEPQIAQDTLLPLEQRVEPISEQPLETIVSPEESPQLLKTPHEDILNALVWWQREVYELFIKGQNYQQISQQLGIPYAAVKLRMSDAERRLKSKNLI